MTARKFYSKHFALVIDLRSTQDNNTHGSGKRIVNTQNGIMLEIRKLATTTNVLCHTFVVSDSLVNFVSKDIKEIVY